MFTEGFMFYGQLLKTQLVFTNLLMIRQKRFINKISKLF